MNAPNFSQIVDDLRAESLDRIERDKRRQAWIDRPLNEREGVILSELSLAVRGYEDKSEFTRADAADCLMDHFTGAGYGYENWLELLRAVDEEDPKAAYAALERAMSCVAKVKHEEEGTVLEWDDLTYVDWDSRR